MRAYVEDLHWQSDWNGYETGYPEVPVVGLYTSADLACDFYINSETGKIIEVMPHEEYFWG